MKGKKEEIILHERFIWRNLFLIYKVEGKTIGIIGDLCTDDTQCDNNLGLACTNGYCNCSVDQYFNIKKNTCGIY